MPFAWYWRQSQIENGESREICQRTVRSQNSLIACQRFGSSSRIENAAAVAQSEPDDRQPELASRQPVRQPHRRDDERRELRPAGERDERAARPRPRDQPEPPDEERRKQRVVRVRARRVLRERVGGPREGKRRAEARPAEAEADEAQPEDAEQVEGDHRRVRGRQVVPAAAPAEEEVAGDVALVRDGPVRVAERVRRLAAAVRLDALADLALGVRRAARLQALLDGHVPVRRLARRRSARRR